MYKGFTQIKEGAQKHLHREYPTEHQIKRNFNNLKAI